MHMIKLMHLLIRTGEIILDGKEEIQPLFVEFLYYIIKLSLTQLCETRCVVDMYL